MKEALSPLRINTSPARKGAIMAKKPATESTRAQGCREYANPSDSDAKPPSRSWAASFPVSLLVGRWALGRGFLHLMIKS